MDFLLATSGKIRCASCNMRYRLSGLQRKTDATREVDFDEQFQKVVIDLPLRQLLTMQQIDTTSVTQKIDAIMLLKINKK